MVRDRKFFLGILDHAGCPRSRKSPRDDISGVDVYHGSYDVLASYQATIVCKCYPGDSVHGTNRCIAGVVISAFIGDYMHRYMKRGQK